MKGKEIHKKLFRKTEMQSEIFNENKYIFVKQTRNDDWLLPLITVVPCGITVIIIFYLNIAKSTGRLTDETFSNEHRILKFGRLQSFFNRFMSLSQLIVDFSEEIIPLNSKRFVFSQILLL